VVISIKALSGTTAGDYYLQRDAGCEANYYLEPHETAGRWVGAGAAAIELAGRLDQVGEGAFRRLLAGADPRTSEQLAGPVVRAASAGRLPPRPLVTALTNAARDRGLANPGDLFADERLAESCRGVEANNRRRPFARSLNPKTAEQLATAAGLDPVEVFRDQDGTDNFTPALAKADEREDVRNAGYDVCVSAPKSVSTLFALADPIVAATVRAAHEAAALTAISYLERETAYGFRGHQGGGQRAGRIGTDGFIGAAFSHQTSRANDPQLHTHVVIANLLHGQDGQWSAIDSRSLFRHATTASYVYHAVLRSELTAKLGVGWTRVEKGIAEIAHLPADLRRDFSTRREAIDAELAATGRTDPAAAQLACLKTRPAKEHLTETELREQWTKAANDLGYVPSDVVAKVLAAEPPAKVSLHAITQELTGPKGLTQRRTTVERRDILQALCQAMPGGSPVSLEVLDDLADLITVDSGVVGLLRGSYQEPRYSTAELVATEQKALALAVVLRASPSGRCASRVPDRSLSREQYCVARDLVVFDRQLAVVVGPAGSGKTAALAAAHAVWKNADIPVYGAAVAALAARGLQRATGIPSGTLDRLLADLDRIDPKTGRPAGCAQGAVLVIDEAGMVDTRTLARLLDHTSKSSARLVLIGDPDQLPEIDAGGLFGALAAQPGTLRLTGNVRQVNDWERDALADLRAGRTAKAMVAYVDAGRIHIGPTAAAVHAAIASDYLVATAEHSPGRVVVLASTRAEAAALNAAIRTELQEHGRLRGEPLSVPTPQGVTDFAVGDSVVITRNHRAFGVLNGTRGQVVGADLANASLRIVDTDGEEHDLDRRLLTTGDVQHGYAMTVHKAQGATVDVALVSGTATLTKEAGYVALSRGTTANHLYATIDDLTTACPELKIRRGTRDVSDGVDRLHQHLARSGAHRLASADPPEPPSWPDEARRRHDALYEPEAPTRGMER
jgi:conjugative relaxase-like TrwC/TraI family protein